MITIEEILGREVFMNVNQLINNVVYGNSGYLIEFIEELQNRIDYEEVINAIEDECDTEDVAELLEEVGCGDLSEINLLDYDNIMAIEEFCSDNGIDTYEYEQEIYEYWAISKWLYGVLLEIGYPVSEFQGMYIMCRITTGQTLSRDYIWQRVQERVMAVING